MILTSKVFGISIEAIVIILFLFIIILGVALFLTYKQTIYISRKYYALMKGKKARDLEQTILTRFKEMDKVKANERKITKEHKKFKGHLDSCYNKMGLVKYNALNDKTGDLSFSLCLLNYEDSGIVLNTMHTNQGCYVYAKEIIKGESYIAISSEEKEAIKKAITSNNNINSIIEEEPEETFEIN